VVGLSCPKGTNLLLTHLEVYKMLEGAWTYLGSWKVILLSKRFHEFSFSSLEDMRRALGVGS